MTKKPEDILSWEDIDWVHIGGVLAEGYSITFLDNGDARMTLYKDDGTEVTWTGELKLLGDNTSGEGEDQ